MQNSDLQTATFGAGCFWGPELLFARVPGVVSTKVGYSQGQTQDPTYEDVCSGMTGHNEVVQVSRKFPAISLIWGLIFLTSLCILAANDHVFFEARKTTPHKFDV